MARRLGHLAGGVALTAATITAPFSAHATATSAARSPQVPTIEQVAEVYPHFAGGSVPGGASGVVPAVRRDCSWGKPYAGSQLRSDDYVPAGTRRDPTRRKPHVVIIALSFRSVRHASDYVADSVKTHSACMLAGASDDAALTTKKLRFGLGDQRFAVTGVLVDGQATRVTHRLLVREGKTVTSTTVASTNGKPAAKRAVRLARLAVRTAR